MITLTLTPAELDLLKEALDSHMYWQLSDEHYRHSGFVHEPGSDDPDQATAIRECETLETKLTAASMRRPKEVT